MSSSITYKIAWKKNDQKMIDDAINFWKESGMLQKNMTGETRAKMLCVVAYDGDNLIGVSTTAISMQPQVMVKACWFRCLVHPDYRQQKIATELASRSLVATEEWSKENPEKKVLCFTIRVETPALFPKCRQPVWHKKLNLIGYTEQGLPLYLYWYKHALVGEESDPDYTFYPSRPNGVGMMHN